MQIELRQLHDKLGMTTIYVTHDQREALTMSDRIAVIAGGRVQQVDTPRKLYERPVNRFVAEFIGESTLLDVDVRDGVCHCAGERLEVAAWPEGGAPRHLLLRPERVYLGDGTRREGHNMLQGQVTDVIYQGDTFLVHAMLANGAASAPAASRTPTHSSACRRVGDAASFGFSARDAVLLPPRHERAGRPSANGPGARQRAGALACDERPVSHAAGLRRDSLVERLCLLGLAAPAVLLILVTMALPVGWLFGLSFLTDSGSFTLAHYQRLIEQPSYARIFGATFKVSFITTGICVLLGLSARVRALAAAAAGRQRCASSR